MSSAVPSDEKLCPLCFTHFRLGDAPIASRRTGRMLKPRSTNGRIFLPRLIDLNNPEFIGEDPHRVCPNPKCAKHLPINIDDMSNELIAIIGSTNSGKSLYITSLIHQLSTIPFLVQVRCNPLVAVEDETSETYLNRYYQPLYVERRPLPITRLGASATTRPLMYQLVNSNLEVQKAINLVFFDIGGEDVANLQNMSEAYNQYITNASAILLLIDPLQVPGLSSEIAKYGGPPVNTDVRRSPVDLMSRLQILFQQQQNLTPFDKISVPTAMVLSKADLLWRLPFIPASAALKRECMHQTGFDRDDNRLVHQEIIHLLLEPFARPVLDQVHARFAKYSFFDVSATGCSPDANGLFPFINPRRCVDPLLWVLWEKGIAWGTK